MGLQEAKLNKESMRKDIVRAEFLTQKNQPGYM
jgi:hypothetical protein